ncbi:MAG: NAD(P)-dependent oxidoreductase [Limisphaerales bacterium]
MNSQQGRNLDARPVWVTGAGGLIGAELVRQAALGIRGIGARVIPITRSELDLTDGRAVRERFARDRPKVVIHCAGLTRGPQCEVEPALARRLNVDVTRGLAALTADAGAVLVFFSTDLLFDGRKGGYTEQDEPNPRGVYAETKREGELATLEHPRHIVLRTTLNYGRSPTGDRSFNEDMVRAVAAGRRLKLFTDEFRTPIPWVATARATWDLVMNGLMDEGGAWGSARPAPSGVFHVAGADRLSRWEIGEIVAELHPELRGAMEPGSIADYDGPPRPADSSMRCERIRPWLTAPLPGFRAWVGEAVAATRDAAPRP